MDIYNLSRNFWNFSFENPEKIKPNHIAMYFFAIEHCNRLGWKEKFGFPTTMVMDAISIKSYNTFIKTLNDLVDYGFFKLIEKSKNQYSSNIIAISKFDKAQYKALDKAITKHSTKQVESTVQSIDSIDIQDYNNTNLQSNNISFDDFWDLYDKKVSRDKSIQKWDKLSEKDKELIMQFIPKYKEYQPDRKFRKDPLTFFNNKTWMDELTSEKPDIIPGETPEERTRRLYVERMRTNPMKMTY